VGDLSEFSAAHHRFAGGDTQAWLPRGAEDTGNKPVLPSFPHFPLRYGYG